jgi:translation initiation factor IF-3
VKSLVQFRGREIVHSHVGLDILRKLAADLGLPRRSWKYRRVLKAT